jgi:DNA replication protein DnaC
MDSGLLALEGLIDLHCRTLKLPGIRKVYRELAREALDNGVSPTQFLLSCLEHEAKSRRENKLKANLRAAKFPEPKTLDQFNFAEIPSLPKAKVLSLFDCQFIRQKENVICVGRQGTGKTHISIALGMAAIEAGFRVKFIKAVTLAQELMAAQQDVRLNKYLKSWKKVDLVILDELGYLQLGPGAAPMFQFIAERYETGSMLVAGRSTLQHNLPLQDPFCSRPAPRLTGWLSCGHHIQTQTNFQTCGYDIQMSTDFEPRGCDSSTKWHSLSS